MKKPILKTFTPISAVAAAFGLAASAAHAQSPAFSYYFPDSWGGTGTAVTDQSTAGNNGFTDGTLSLSTAVPPLGGNGTESINTSAGGILTSANALLSNANVAAAGGFTFNVSFLWSGTDSSSFGHTEKLIDYAGTESLQLITTNIGGAASATLQMAFANDKGAESIPVSMTGILPNTWYSVTMTFDNTTWVNGDVNGTADLNVNGVDVGSGAATKGTYGDSLNRPIGIGQLGANFGYLVGFKGDIFDPSVSFIGQVPEPSTLALGALGSLGLMLQRRRKSKS